MQFIDALYGQCRGADTVDLGTHLDQAFGNINDFRLARGILNYRFAPGQCRSHHGGVGCPDRHHREGDPVAGQAAGCPGHHIAVFDFKLGAQFTQRHEIEIYRPCADGTAARQGNARIVKAGQQRPENPEAGTHFRNQVIGRGSVDNFSSGKMHRFTGLIALAGAFAVGALVNAVIVQNALQQLHVSQPGQVFERQRFCAQKARDHQRQGGVFRTRNLNFAIQFVAAADSDPVHALFVPFWYNLEGMLR